MFNKPFILWLALCSLFLGQSVGVAAAAEKFPERPINMSIPFASGTTDMVGRLLAQGAEKILGVPIVAANRTGGLGTTAVMELYRKKNDGYNIGITSQAAFCIAPHQMDVPYTIEDFDFIMAFGQFRYGLFVRADSPFKTLAEVVAAAKEKPLSYGAVGQQQTIVMNKLARQTQAKFTFVASSNLGELHAQILGGHLDLLSAVVGTALPFYKSGEFRCLAVFANEQLPELPGIPTATELGYPIVMHSYFGLAAPKGVPADRLAILHKAFLEAFNASEFQEFMKKAQIPAVYVDGPELKKLFENDYVSFKAELEAIGMVKKK